MIKLFMRNTPPAHNSSLPTSIFTVFKKGFLGNVQTRLCPHVASCQTQQIAFAGRIEATCWLIQMFFNCAVWHRVSTDVPGNS